MGILQRGMAFLTDRLATAAAVSVTYTRGGTSAAITDAVVGVAPEIEQQPTPEARARQVVEERDYLIPPTALAVFGEPAVGDRVTETINGVPVTFVVCRRFGERCWRWADPERTSYRIHTKAA